MYSYFDLRWGGKQHLITTPVTLLPGHKWDSVWWVGSKLTKPKNLIFGCQPKREESVVQKQWMNVSSQKWWATVNIVGAISSSIFIQKFNWIFTPNQYIIFILSSNHHWNNFTWIFSEWNINDEIVLRLFSSRCKKPHIIFSSRFSTWTPRFVFNTSYLCEYTT